VGERLVVAAPDADVGPRAVRRLEMGAQRVLVEASPLDRVWGIGLAADDPRAADPAGWRGLNLLGFALMEARDLLSGRS